MTNMLSVLKSLEIAERSEASRQKSYFLSEIRFNNLLVNLHARVNLYKK